MPTLEEIYGYGILGNGLCCICSLGGAAILPCSRRCSCAYNIFLSIFLGLAVGTLFTGAVVHLIPEALGLHKHSTRNNDTEDDNDDDLGKQTGYHVETHVWYSIIVLLGTYLFYLVEMIMCLVKNKNKKAAATDSDTTSVTKSFIDVYIPNEQQNGNFHKMAESNHGNGFVDKTTSSEHAETVIMVIMAIAGDSIHNTADELALCQYLLAVWLRITPLVIMVIVGDAIHNIADGLALGAAFTSSIAEGISLTIAIFCHELPHELGDFAILVNSGMGFCKAVLANLFSSLTAFIGFIIGVQVSADETSRQWIFAITAGMFLYISLSDMLPELKRLGSRDTKTFIYHNIGILFGALILVVIAVFEKHIRV